MTESAFPNHSYSLRLWESAGSAVRRRNHSRVATLRANRKMSRRPAVVPCGPVRRPPTAPGNDSPVAAL